MKLIDRSTLAEGLAYYAAACFANGNDHGQRFLQFNRGHFTRVLNSLRSSELDQAKKTGSFQHFFSATLPPDWFPSSLKPVISFLYHYKRSTPSETLYHINDDIASSVPGKTKLPDRHIIVLAVLGLLAGDRGRLHLFAQKHDLLEYNLRDFVFMLEMHPDMYMGRDWAGQLKAVDGVIPEHIASAMLKDIELLTQRWMGAIYADENIGTNAGDELNLYRNAYGSWFAVMRMTTTVMPKQAFAAGQPPAVVVQVPNFETHIIRDSMIASHMMTELLRRHYMWGRSLEVLPEGIDDLLLTVVLSQLASAYASIAATNN